MNLVEHLGPYQTSIIWVTLSLGAEGADRHLFRTVYHIRVCGGSKKSWYWSSPWHSSPLAALRRWFQHTSFPNKNPSLDLLWYSSVSVKCIAQYLFTDWLLPNRCYRFGKNIIIGIFWFLCLLSFLENHKIRAPVKNFVQSQIGLGKI